jgi:hypothetical protein
MGETMTARPPTLMRCERCKAAISAAEAARLIRHGVPCGICGGTLTLRDGSRRPQTGADQDGAGVRPPSAERRLLEVLREADGRPVQPTALTEAGILDPASAIFELELAGHRIERAYAGASTGKRRFLGYRLRAAKRRAPVSPPARG